MTEGPGAHFKWDLVSGTIGLPSGRQQKEFDELSVVLTTDTGESLRVPGERSDDTIQFDRSSLRRPVVCVRVFQVGESHALSEIGNLLPKTDSDFEAHFKSKRDRANDPYVDFFVGWQTHKYFSGSIGYRISAAVVAAYKAIEILDYEYLDMAEEALLASLELLPNTKVERSTRKNREHLHVSVLCALWHLQMARGKCREFKDTLEQIRSLLHDGNFHSFFNPAFNGSVTLRVLTLLQKMEGRDARARRTARLAFDIFKLGTRDADTIMNHFKELGYVHNHVLQTLRLSKRPGEISDALVEKTLQSCLRVPAEEFPDSFDVMKETFMQAAYLDG